MPPPSGLDDPEIARHAWARYRRLMRWMAWLALAAVVGALVVVRVMHGPGLSWHMIVATAGGVGISVLLTAALMGLVFLSSGSGHDESIEDRLEEERNR